LENVGNIESDENNENDEENENNDYGFLYLLAGSGNAKKSQRHYSHDCENRESIEYQYHSFSRVFFHTLPTFSAYQRKAIEDLMVATRARVQN
jgi:hypothetical protein